MNVQFCLVVHKYPSYNKLSEEKQKCYPAGISVDANEAVAVVQLQQLLDHTAARLLLSLETNITDEELILYHKWGFDCSSGHSQYKQAFETAVFSDASVAITTIVPVQLLTNENYSPLWVNTSASSTRYS